MILYTEESKEDKWITISHQHVLVGADGTIKAGLGGKFNGKPVQHAIDHLTSQKSSPKAKAPSSKEKVDKPKSKMQHAHDIIKNASPDALAKDIKKHLADKLGLSPAAASTYYHNIKKKLAAQAEKEKPEEKKVDKSSDIDFPKEHVKEVADLIKDNSESHTAGMIIGHVKDWYKISEKSATELYNKALAKVKGATPAPKKTYKDVVDKVEGKTSKAKQAEQIYNQMLGSKSKDVKAAFVDKLGISPATASTYYHNIKKKMGDSPAPEDDTTNTNFTPAKTITSDDIHDIIDNNYSAGKDAVIKKIKDKFGLNNGDAIAHFDNVHSAWVEKKAKKEVPIIAKNYLEKNAAEPKEFFKNAYMIGDKEAEHIMGMHNSVLDDLVSGSSQLSVSGLKNKIQSMYPLDDTQSTDLADVIKQYNKAQVNWDKVSDTFWNIHDKKKLSGHKDYVMDQNEQELAALDIVKKMHKTHSPVDIHAEIAETLGIDYDKAYSLMKKAEKVVSKKQLDDISAKPTTYEDMKDKINSSTGGAKIHYNHGEDASIPVPEHVQKFRSRVKVAKEINAHMALDPHDHLIKVNSPNFYPTNNQPPSNKQVMSKAVYMYTGSDYHEINTALRTKSIKNSYHKETVDELDKVFAHPSAKIKKETIVYRGYTSKIVNNLEPGDIFEDKGYMSTTSEEYKAESWAHSGGAVMHIVLPVGANAISARPYSQFQSEHEVLLNRGAKIRIIEKAVKKSPNDWEDDQITFYAEYVVDKNKK